MRNKLLLTLGAAFSAALSCALPAHSSATRAVAVLQGQSNAFYLQDEGLGGGWTSIFKPMVQAFTGIPTVDVYNQPNFTGVTNYTIVSGTPTYDSTVSGGDSSLWLWANSTNASAWPLGTYGQACYNYIQGNASGIAAGVPYALFRFHSEYDSKKTGTDASYYAAANHNFVGQLRTAAGLSATRMPVFYGSPAFAPNVTSEGAGGVRAAWLAEINNPANNAHWSILCDNDTVDRGDFGSHMNQEGDHQCAARMAFAYARWLYDNGYSVNDLSSLPKLGPRMSRFDRVSGVANQIDITIVHDKGTDIVIPSGASLGGFEINDNGTSLSATAASRVNATTLRLTLSANLSASTNITLDYLFWNGYYTPGTLITDNYHLLSKPSYIANAISTYYANLKLPLRKLEQPLTLGVTDGGSLDDQTNQPQAQIAAGTPVIDGNVDAAWSNAPVNTLSKSTGVISSGADCSATWQGLWDASNLYILANVTDDVKTNDSVNAYDDDAVEIYLDADHNGGTTYDANDRQVICGWGDAAAVEGAGRSITGVTFAKADPTGTTYRIEAKIPWAVEAFTPANNAIIGIDVHVDDDDDGGARDGKVIWNDGSDNAWQNPNLFGTAKLNAAPAIPPVPTGLTATAGNAQVGLSWSASTGATSYNVKRSTVSGSGFATVASATVTNYTNTGLTNGTTYYYVVSAVNAAGESANSAQASAMPHVTAPAAPTGITATPGNTQVALSWTASTGATSYNVKRSTVTGTGYVTVASPTTTSYTNTGLTNGTTYFYVVSAVNTGGESANSTEVSAQPFAAVPQAQIAAGTATIDGNVDAAWSNATSYPMTKTTGTITNASDCSGSWQGMWDATNVYILASVTDDVKVNDSTNPWDDDGVEIYLDADHNGGSSYDANDRQIVCGWGDAAPVEGGGRAITGVTFAKADPTGTTYRIEAKIPWAVEAFTPANNAIIGIDVHINDDDDGAARDGKVIWNDGTDQAWTNPSLFGAGKLNAAGGIPAAPTGVTATPGNTQIALSWTASTGATSYNVKRSTVSGSGYATVSSPATTSYTNTGLTNGTTYYYVVTAVNASGESGNSSQVSGIPIDPNVHTGTWAVKGVLTGTPGHTICSQITSASSGQTYVASLWIKGTGSINLHVYHGSWGTELPVTQCTATGTWQKITTAAFSTGTDTQVTFSIQDDFNTAGTVYIDDAFIGVANGTNMLVNPGFESGNTTWFVNAPFSIVQNP